MSHKRTFDYDYCYGKQNEEEVLKIVNEYFEDDAETTSKFCKYDFKGKNIYELKRDNNLEQEIETDRFKRLLGMLIIQRYIRFNLEENRVESITKEIKNDKEWIGDEKEIGFIPTLLQHVLEIIFLKVI